MTVPLFSSEVCIAMSSLITGLLMTCIFFQTCAWLLKIYSWFVDFFLLVKDLKVWRTDPGSIFDLDPLEDNIQSRSLHMLSGTAYILSCSPFMWFCPESEGTLSGRGSWYQLCDVNLKVEVLKNQKKKKMLCGFKIPLIIYENKLCKRAF